MMGQKMIVRLDWIGLEDLRHSHIAESNLADRFGRAII